MGKKRFTAAKTTREVVRLIEKLVEVRVNGSGGPQIDKREWLKPRVKAVGWFSNQ